MAVVYKLTIDVNLMAAGLKLDAMDTLKRWEAEGKIQLLEADPPKTAAYGWPGAAPQPPPVAPAPWGRQRRRLKKSEESGNASFKSVAAVLFPGKDPWKLNMSEVNNVAHLIRHHSTKNDIFVTNNSTFLEGGRREVLKSYFGITAMNPDEVVRWLEHSDGWDGSK